MTMSKTSPRIDITHPYVAIEWHPTKNGDLEPCDFTHGSHTKVWWVCSDCHSEYEAVVGHRARAYGGSGCPFCAGEKVNETNCLAMTHPGIAAEWHPSKNGKLTASDITHASGSKFWWICPDCHSDYEAPAGNRTRPVRASGCPFCAGQKVNETNCLAILRPDIAKEWHPLLNGGISTHSITCGTPKKMWWICPKCASAYSSSACDRTTYGVSCPYCAGRKVNETNSLASLRPDLSSEWDTLKNGNKTPQHFTLHSGSKAWWICKDNHHSYIASINHRADGSGCPYCFQSKGENLTGKYLNAILPSIKVVGQFLVKRPGRKKPLQVDFRFVIGGQEYFVEYDGEQHYRPVNFGSMSNDQAVSKFEDQVKRDGWLSRYCIDNGIKLISVDGRKFKGEKIKPQLEKLLVASGARLP